MALLSSPMAQHAGVCCCLGVVCGGLRHNLKPNPLVWLFFISLCALRRASFDCLVLLFLSSGSLFAQGCRRGSADLEGSADRSAMYPRCAHAPGHVCRLSCNTEGHVWFYAAPRQAPCTG